VICVCPYCGGDVDCDAAAPGVAPGVMICPACGQELDRPGQAAPALAHRLGPHAPQPSLPADLDQPGAQWALLQGGAGLTGFALRPEQTPPDTNIPSLPRETALRITQASPIPLLQALGQAMPPVGRGLVLGYTPLRTPRDRYLFLDAPTELLDRRDVPFWLVRLERAHPFNRGSFSLWRATEARPVSLDGTVHPAPGR